MTEEIKNGIFLLVPLFLQLVGLTFAVFADSYIKKKHRRVMVVIIALIVVLIAQNYLEYLLQVWWTAPRLRTLVGIFGYCIRPVILVMFCYIVGKERKYDGYVWLLIAVNTAIHLTAVFSDICFAIDADNHFHRGPLGYTCHIVSMILLVYLTVLTVKEYRSAKKIGALIIPCVNALLILAAAILDVVANVSDRPVTYLTMAVVSCSVFYYIWLHLQFVREHERTFMAEQRIRIMLSQIQPHFIYNSLSSISELCETDPKEAQRLTDDFAGYLRSDFSALTTDAPVPLTKELEQVGFYLSLEKARFQDRLNIRYDVQADEFVLPTLTVQPLVENAVKHGVCKKDEGGTVTIRSYETDTQYVVEIEDDGVGFDVDDFASDGKLHVGIENVRARLASCGDALTIKSEKGKGTTVTITVPKPKEVK